MRDMPDTDQGDPAPAVMAQDQQPPVERVLPETQVREQLPPPSNPPSRTTGREEILGALDALPEKIVKGIKELVPNLSTPPNQRTVQNAQSNAQKDNNGYADTAANTGAPSRGNKSGGGGGDNSTPQRKTFSQWWFGS